MYGVKTNLSPPPLPGHAGMLLYNLESDMFSVYASLSLEQAPIAGHSEFMLVMVRHSYIYLFWTQLIQDWKEGGGSVQRVVRVNVPKMGTATGHARNSPGARSGDGQTEVG